MEFLNASGMAAGFTVGLDVPGAEHLIVVVKGTFTLPQPGATPKLADKQLPLVDADEFSGEPGKSATLAECDYVLTKPKCDVLLHGAAHAPNGRPAPYVGVGLRVAEFTKSFAVCGHRVWRRDMHGYQPSEPTPFLSTPFSYDTAFGGTDSKLPDLTQHRSYLPNPVGCGWHHHVDDSIVGSPVCNTEALDDPVRDPSGRYAPLALGQIGRSSPLRSKFAGTYDQDWLDNVFPFLPTDFDTRYFQAAPPDQQIQKPLGGEPVTLINLTPDGHREFSLPSVQLPIAFIPCRGARVEAAGALDTILFEPEMERFTLVWRATLKLRRDIFEIARTEVGRMAPSRHSLELEWSYDESTREIPRESDTKGRDT